ncbi:hypothetical protein cypCar_00041916 [Cyprinus carpio]|nr:hypothetical protein cypCar_00041916 [Cyprinus carpio]
MTLITVIIWTLTTCTWSSVGQIVTQSEDQTVKPDQTVTIQCNHKPAVNYIKPGLFSGINVISHFKVSCESHTSNADLNSAIYLPSLSFAL